MHYSTKSTSLNQVRATLNQVLITFPLLNVGARRRDACENQTRHIFPPPQIKTEKAVWPRETRPDYRLFIGL